MFAVFVMFVRFVMNLDAGVGRAGPEKRGRWGPCNTRKKCKTKSTDGSIAELASNEEDGLEELQVAVVSFFCSLGL